MEVPDREEIERLLSIDPVEWTGLECVLVSYQLINLYEHWFRKEFDGWTIDGS